MRRSQAGHAPRRRSGTGMFFLVLLGLTLGALGHVAIQAQKNEIAVELGREQAVYEALVMRQRHQQIEIGRLKNPGRLVDLARERLGMTPRSAGIRVVQPPPRSNPRGRITRAGQAGAP